MRRDILDFTEPIPVERLGLREVGPEGPNEAALPPPEAGSRFRGLVYLLVTVAGLGVAAGVGYLMWSTSGRPDLVVNDRPIGNPEEILAASDDLFRLTVEADGASQAEGASCFFAEGNRAPFVVCGPVWLGVSPDEEPWLVVDTAYAVVDDEAVGEVGEIRDTTTVEPRQLTRPDGKRPIEVGEVERSLSGLRRASGAQLVDPEVVLAGAEAALSEELDRLADQVSLTLSEDNACFLQEGPDLVHGVPVVGDTAWCGPARQVDSRPEEVWIPVSLRYQRGLTYGAPVFETASPSVRVRSLPESATLFRPDGLQPGDAGSVDRPPVATDFAQVVDYELLMDAAGQSSPLVTERYRIDFTAFERTDTIGSGARSFTAPPDHDLVVAAIAPVERSASPRGFLLIDGVERPLPRWTTGQEGGALIVAVPEAATSVAMTIENDGRPQTLSILDGTLEAGFPLALYRSEAAIDQPFVLRVEMPAGEAVLVTGLLASAEWSARDSDGNWLPDGESRLMLVFDEWNVDRPCCEVDVQAMTATFTLLAGSEESPDEEPVDAVDPDETSTDQDAVDPDETSTDPGEEPTTVPTLATFNDQREDPTAAPNRRSPTFDVPEELSVAVLRIDVETLIVADETERTLPGELELVVMLP